MKLRYLTLLTVALLLAPIPLLPASKATEFMEVYIQSDGSVAPKDAPISRAGNVYKLTRDLYGRITVDAEGVILDSDGYTLLGGERAQACTLELATSPSGTS